MRIHYDATMDRYYAYIQLDGIEGQEIYCESPRVLAEVLHRLDDRETRREDARGTWVAILLAAVLIAVAAWVAKYF